MGLLGLEEEVDRIFVRRQTSFYVTDPFITVNLSAAIGLDGRQVMDNLQKFTLLYFGTSFPVINAQRFHCRAPRDGVNHEEALLDTKSRRT